jgi:hypothetical protein
MEILQLIDITNNSNLEHFTYININLNPVPNAQVCVYLMVNITKLQLQTTFPKPLYIPHSTCIHRDPVVENLDVCTACDP